MLTSSMKQYTMSTHDAFGESCAAMKLEDLDKFVVNPACELHILRHFRTIEPHYAKTLVGQEYYYFDYERNTYVKSVITPQDIQIALQTKGSKFYPNTLGLETPKKVLARVQSELKKKIRMVSVSWIEKETFASVKFSFDYERAVGDKDVIALSTLTKAEKAKVHKTSRSDHSSEKSVMINTVAGVRKSKINTVSVEIVKTDALPFYFVTAYPGELGPDFPHSSQSNEEFADNKKYWDRHVFIL